MIAHVEPRTTPLSLKPNEKTEAYFFKRKFSLINDTDQTFVPSKWKFPIYEALKMGKNEIYVSRLNPCSKI